MSPIHPAFALLALVVVPMRAEQPPAVVSAKPSVAAIKTPALPVENASNDFPLTLRGFFGKGDSASVSVQDKVTGKSAWIKPGESHAGWKLEKMDTPAGRAVFSREGRRVILRQAGEVPAPPGALAEEESPRLKLLEDSVLGKKFPIITREPKNEKLLRELERQSNETLRKTHPEFFEKDGSFADRNPGALIAQSVEMKRLLNAMESAEAESIKPTLNTMFDSIERMKLFAKDDVASESMHPKNNDDDWRLRKAEHDNRALANVYRIADWSYAERTGGK